jgi:hypothetical protein
MADGLPLSMYQAHRMVGQKMQNCNEGRSQRKRVKPLPDLCYLCGRQLIEPISDDHVPMKQLFAPEVRKAHNPSNLLTIPVHDRCNKSYQPDEDYFVYSLMPFARGSYSGSVLYQKVLGDFRGGKKTKLVRKVLDEFELRPSGLMLPGNKVVKRFDGNRIARIAWKIVRGLYFHHHNEVLPADLTTWVSLTPPNEIPPEHFRTFMGLADNEPQGQYPGVFAYRFQRFTEALDVHYWALLIWDRIILTVIFHDPRCDCMQCRSRRSPEKLSNANVWHRT